MSKEKSVTLSQVAELLKKASDPNVKIVLMHKDGKRMWWSCACGQRCESQTPECLSGLTHAKTCDWYV